MNVAVITHFYSPEPSAGALRVESLVDALGEAGHDVTVVTNFPSFPSGRFQPGHRPFFSVERVKRSRVVRLPSLLFAGKGSRFVHWISAALSASLYMLATRLHFDVIVVSSPPITLALPGIVAALRHDARLVTDVRDVFPDIAIAMGEWKSDGLLSRAVELVARTLYRRSDLVVAVTPTAAAQIARRGIGESRLVLAPNAPERRAVAPHSSSNGGRFTAIYAGNLGVASDVDVLLDAAALVKADGIALDIVGDGAQRSRLEERIRGERIANVSIKGSVPRDNAMAMVANADVSIVPLRRGIHESVPTKLYDALSVGCPVIVVADGEAKRAGASLGAFHSPAGDASALAALLRQLSLLDKDALRELGNEAKARVDAGADRAAIMTGVVRAIEGLG